MALDDDLYRLLFEASSTPMWVCDRETLKIIAVNDAAVRLHGWSREEFLTMTLRDLRPPAEREAFDALYTQSRTNTYSRASRHWTKSGETIEVSLEISRFTWQGREVSVANATDVTGIAQAERRFNLMLEKSQDAISIVNEHNVTVYVSPGAERILERPLEELVGTNALQLVHPDDLVQYEFPPPGETRHHLARVRHRNGTWRWIESWTTNLYHEPAIRGVLANYRDVTDRKAAETAMLEWQRRLEYLLSATSAITYSANVGGACTFISANVQAVLGHAPQQFYESRDFWRSGVHPDDQAMVQQWAIELRKNGAETLEYRFRHADGSYRWMRDAARITRYEDGRPSEVVGFWVDVTDHKRAEIQLRRSEANFRTMIERSPAATFVHRDGSYIYVNPAAVALLGYTRAEDMIGKSVFDFIHPDDREAIRQRLQTSVEVGVAGSGEVRMIRRDGGIVVVEVERILLDFDGAPANVVIGRDVTERRELFARRALADRMLTVGTLAAGVAHEINNPLAYVAANLSILDGELPALLPNGSAKSPRGDLQGLVSDARDGVARMSAIVRELRALARPEDDTRGPVDVAAVLASSIKMAHNEIRHRAHVVQAFDPEAPPVYAHASRLGQVFLNLLLNAAQAITDGRADEHEIRVRTRRSSDGEHVCVDIEDTGIGIPPSIIRRIFDPFFTTKAPGIGMGLGLAISHQIVRAMDGEITVESRPGHGSTFTVTLPIARASVASATAASCTSALAGLRILVIDDEAAVGRSLCALLAPEHEVVPVVRAQEALDRLDRGERFDVILCDLMMPEMSGMELYERVAAELQRRIIFITGGAFTPQARQFLAGVARPHLEKPFDEDDLRRAIGEVI